MDKREVEELLGLLKEINSSLKLMALCRAVQVAGTSMGMRDEVRYLQQIEAEAALLSDAL